MIKKRSDGRKSTELRPTFVAVGRIGGNALGSAVEIGGSRVVCVVRGPMQLTAEQRGSKGKVSVRVKRAPFAVPRSAAAARAAGGRPDDSDHALSSVLESILEQTVLLESIPQLLFELTVEIISSDSADLACSIVAVNTALVHAGVQCVDIIAGATVALCADGSFLFDPAADEMDGTKALCTVCACTGTAALAYVSHRGAVDPVVALSLVEAATAGCVTMRDTICSQLHQSSSSVNS